MGIHFESPLGEIIGPVLLTLLIGIIVYLVIQIAKEKKQP